MVRSSCLFLLPLLLSACDTGTDPCTEEARAGLSVLIREAGTDLPAAEDAAVVAGKGAFTEALAPLDSLRFYGLFERPGVYRITVTKPGYGVFDTSGVRVEADRCHVELTTITVRLQPE